MARSTRILIACSIALLVSACASQIDAGVSAGEDVPGFWWGLWHGFIFPWAWIGSLFDSDIAVYAVPNTGAWYDFGFFVGITVLGGGSWFSSKKRSN
jgi:LPXTG-motif cell wall-anchored protein